MAKPIFIARFPCRYIPSKKEMSAAQKDLQEALGNEYHAIVLGGGLNDDWIFEVHNVDKEPEIDYKGLKKLLNV